MTDELRIEQYKALKEEYRQYLVQVQQLWKYKFATLGAIISVAVLNDKILSSLRDTPTGIANHSVLIIILWGFALMPLLSLVIDLKMYEIGLHVRSISNFLRTHYPESEIHAWESQVWIGTKESKTRTILTLAGALGTSALIILSSWIISFQLIPGYKTILMIWYIMLSCGLIFGMIKARSFLLKEIHIHEEVGP